MPKVRVRGEGRGRVTEQKDGGEAPAGIVIAKGEIP